MSLSSSKNLVTAEKLASVIGGSDGTGGLWGKTKALVAALDGTITGTAGAGKTLTALSQTDGKVSATFDSISITKSQVSDFPTSMTPSSHTHGNINNDGTLSDTAAAAAGNDYVVIRDADNNKIQTSTIKGTDVADAVSNKHSHSTLTLSTTAQAYDGTHTLALPSSDPYSSARIPTSHTHGNIQNSGALQTNDITVASGDKLVVTDSSDSSKVARTSISFDGSTTTKALTPKGTWETFNNYSHPTTTAADAAAVKVGKDSLGHVVIGGALSKSDVGLGSVANTGDSDTPVSGGTTKFTTGGAYTELAKKANLASPALTGTPTAPTPSEGDDSTKIATTAFVKTAVEQGLATADALTYKGTVDGGSTGAYGALTPAASKGDVYKVATAGKIDGVAVEVGDMLICNTDSTAAATSSDYATIAANWDFIQGNTEGVVVGPASSTDGNIALFDGTTGKLLKNSSYSPSSFASSSHNHDSVYFKSSGSTTLVSGAATKIGTSNGADVTLTLPTIPAAANNGALNIGINGETATSKFTANQSTDSTLTFAEGATDGTIAVDGTDVAVHGLGSAAYTASTDYATSSHTHSVTINGSTKTIPASGGTAVDLGTYVSSINGFQPNSSGNVVAYGTCSTAASTTTKVVTLAAGTPNLVAGASIIVWFSNKNTASSPKLAIGETTTTISFTYSKYKATDLYGPVQFVLTGSGLSMAWNVVGLGKNLLDYGIAYAGTCSTPTSTTAKTVSLTDFVLTTGGIVTVTFQYDVGDSATLNINSTGAKSIYYRGSSLTSGYVFAHDVVTLQYDGSHYCVLSIVSDRRDSIATVVSKTPGDSIQKIATTYKFDLDTYVGIPFLIRFTMANTVAAVTLNINNTGEKQLLVNGEPVTVYNTFPAGVFWCVYTGTAYNMDVPAQLDGRVMPVTVDYARGASSAATISVESAIGDSATGVYIASNGRPVACDYSVNKTVPADAVFTDTVDPAKLGSGYGTCSTEAATTAKAATLSNYVLRTGGHVSVKFTYAVPASATLNINSAGAKDIYYRGSAITAGVIGAGDTATFVYDGTQYQLLSIDSGEAEMTDAEVTDLLAALT